MTDKTRTKLEQIEKLKADGKSTSEACQAVGLSKNSYYTASAIKRKQAAKRRNYKPRLTTIPIVDSQTFSGGKIFALVGAPEEVMKAIRAVL